MQDYHYFVSSYDIWTVDEDLNLALKRFWERSQSNSCNVFKVPLMLEAKYEINFYQPQVEGVQFIDNCYRTEADRKEAQ